MPMSQKTPFKAVRGQQGEKKCFEKDWRPIQSGHLLYFSGQSHHFGKKAGKNANSKPVKSISLPRMDFLCCMARLIAIFIKSFTKKLPGKPKKSLKLISWSISLPNLPPEPLPDAEVLQPDQAKYIERRQAQPNNTASEKITEFTGRPELI